MIDKTKICGGAILMEDMLVKVVDPELLNKIRLVKHSDFPKSDTELPAFYKSLEEETRPVVYWKVGTVTEAPHNLKTPDQWKYFDKVVFVSYWQAYQFQLCFGFPVEKSVVLQNAITTEFETRDKCLGDKVKLIYTSTPYRGLDVALHVVNNIPENIDWELDVYSSLKIYGWSDEQDNQYKALYDFCKNHPNINYHGSVPNSEVKEALKESDILLYPSTFQETSCISVIEAMAAGCEVVTTSLGALPETCSNFGTLVPFTHDKDVLIQRVTAALLDTIEDYNFNWQMNQRRLQVRYFKHFYCWSERSTEWEMFIENLLNEVK